MPHFEMKEHQNTTLFNIPLEQKIHSMLSERRRWFTQRNRRGLPTFKGKLLK
jgi:hypothetical protein